MAGIFKHVLQLIFSQQDLPGSHPTGICATVVTGMRVWGRLLLLQYIALTPARALPCKIPTGCHPSLAELRAAAQGAWYLRLNHSASKGFDFNRR